MSRVDSAAQQPTASNDQKPSPGQPSPPDLGDIVSSFLDEAARSGGLGKAILDEENRRKLAGKLRPCFATHFKDLFLLIPWMAFTFSWISGIVMGLVVQVVVHTIVHTAAPVTWLWVLITILISIACGASLGLVVKGQAEKSILKQLREMGAALGPEDRATWKHFKAFTQQAH